MKTALFNTTLVLVALACAPAVLAEAEPRDRGAAQGDQRVGVRILTDLVLFPREPLGARGRILIDKVPETQPEGPDVLTRLREFSQHASSQRVGHVSTGVMSGYAPRIDAVVQKYGKPDRVVREARDLGDESDLVHYWGDYGLAVRATEPSGEVIWVRRLLTK